LCLLSSIGLSDKKSMGLKYEPSSEPMQAHQRVTASRGAHGEAHLRCALRQSSAAGIGSAREMRIPALSKP
jgi:hypothetical protein